MKNHPCDVAYCQNSLTTCLCYILAVWCWCCRLNKSASLLYLICW